MALESPILDDRRFQEIVDELRKRIPEYCAEWTDINLSDPGITLIELFAWMTETILYRLNRVPLLHYVKFMDLFGITLKPPQAARVPITFWFSAPQPAETLIEAATQVATTQTENTPPVIYATREPMRVRVPKLEAILSGTPDAQRRSQFRDMSKRKDPQRDHENIFSSQPRAGDALYFGFGNDLSNHIVRIDLVVDVLQSSGVDETRPPLIWEVATANSETWEQCTLDPMHNTIGGFNRNGHIQLYLPRMGEVELGGQTLFWVRVRLTDAQHLDRESRYMTSPHLQHVRGCYAMGATIEAEHAQIIREETIGESSGVPGQHFRLQAAPIVMPMLPEERLRVQVEGERDEYWERVESFAGKTPFDTCYTLDGITGELRFGPSIRLRNGEFLQLGKTPPKGAVLVFERYRQG
ncbi:MAG: putative baseplate assembly protein, partial [Caldilineaceae bacterium]|nr:putative baseplate assembly protein [Caldilineaceae bacterium]